MRPAAVFIFILIAFSAAAQNDSLKYWIQFTDKSNTPYSINNPEEFLSARAIERRERQNIPIEVSDLPVDPAYISAVRSLGAKILHSSRWFNAVTISTNDTTLLQAVNALSFVQNYDIVVKAKDESPYEKDESFNIAQGKYAYDYGPSYNQIAMINGDILHDLGFTGEGMIIAVLDAGFLNWDELDVFEKLRDEGKILATYDFVDQETSVDEDHNHGTNVLSVMGGYMPGKLVGTAPNASYFLLRSEDVGSELIIEEDNWVAAAEWADSAGADIINSSLGYNTFDDSTMDHSYSDLDGNTTRVTIGADMAAKKGMLIVNSAGNEGNGNWKYIIAPADGDSVMAVGGVGPNEVYISFASQGPSADGRVKPNVAAQAYQVVLASAGGGVVQANGTSFASPIIAGMAACLWQANRNAGNMEIFNAIEQSASLYPDYNNLIGYGIPNFVNAHYILTADAEGPIVEAEPFIYPNPFKDIFNLIIMPETEADATISIYDVLGRLHYTMPLYFRSGNKYILQIDKLMNAQRGIYFVKISTENHSEVLKILKQ